jgi:hypothetical protein
MLIALADENAGAEASLREQIDTVATAKKFLVEHPTACKQPSHRGHLLLNMDTTVNTKGCCATVGFGFRVTSERFVPSI